MFPLKTPKKHRGPHVTCEPRVWDPWTRAFSRLFRGDRHFQIFRQNMKLTAMFW